MKQHVFIYCIIISICLGISLSGCRAKKSLQKTQENTTIVERSERYSDSTRTEQKSTVHIDRSRDENERSYTRTTEYDSTGNIRRISEEWRDRQSSDLVVRDHRQESISVTGSEKQVIEEDSSSTVIRETMHIQSDSRPVQGAEWLWVIVAGTLVLSVVIFVIIKKTRKKWPL